MMFVRQLLLAEIWARFPREQMHLRDKATQLHGSETAGIQGGDHRSPLDVREHDLPYAPFPRIIATSMDSKIQTLTMGREPPTGGFPYPEKYVAFVDMLGFRNLVESADASAEKRQALARIVGIFRATIGAHESLGTRVSHFSDSLIVSAERSEQGLHAMLSGCTWLALNLVQYAVLLRGGIAVGGITHEANLLFGIGVNRAYAFEKPGLPPRIGLAQDVVGDIQRSAMLSNVGFIAQDHAGGGPMLHTLREIEA